GEVLPHLRTRGLVDDDALARGVRAARGMRELVGIAQRLEKSRIARVWLSSTSRSVNSPTLKSDSLPTETSLEKPTPRPSPRESSPPSMLSLWETIASGPVLICAISSTPLTAIAHPGSVFTSPIQFGPMTRTPP